MNIIKSAWQLKPSKWFTSPIRSNNKAHPLHTIATLELYSPVSIFLIVNSTKSKSPYSNLPVLDKQIRLYISSVTKMFPNTPLFNPQVKAAKNTAVFTVPKESKEGVNGLFGRWFVAALPQTTQTISGVGTL